MRSPNDASAAITAWFSAGSASRSIRSPISDRFLSAPTAAIAAFATSTSSSSTSVAQLAVEGVGQDRQQPRRFEPRPPAVVALLFDHLRQQQLRGVEVLRPARARQERDDRGLDREVLEVAERLDPLERVHRIEFGQVQQRLGSDAKVRILHQRLDLVLDRRIAGARQQPHRLLADRGILVTQQAADGRMHLAIVRQLEQAERVGDLASACPSAATR